MYIPVIFYHSVAPKKNPAWIKKYLTLELDLFEYQMKFLHEKGYETIFLDEYFDILSSGSAKGKKYICITFDDGFLDNWIYAFPILQKYNFKGTIFVSPEFVDKKASVRKTLNEYWSGKTTLREIGKWGYLSWEEMATMESSGLIDIQSHTMSHAELFISDRIVDFHRPGGAYLYPIGNLFPDRKPYYIEDDNFEKLIPYGYPFFESTSSLIARKVEINPVFNEEVSNRLKETNWKYDYDFENLLKQIEPIYSSFKNDNALIIKRENEEEYNKRLTYELQGSRDIIELMLNKRVKYLCWPNHHYNDYTCSKAREIGYKASDIFLKGNEKRPEDRYDRISILTLNKNKFTSVLINNIKLKGYHTFFPLNYAYKFSQRNNKAYSMPST